MNLYSTVISISLCFLLPGLHCSSHHLNKVNVSLLQVVSVNRTLAERGLGVWVDEFWTPTMLWPPNPHPPIDSLLISSLGPRSRRVPSPTRHTTEFKKIVFSFSLLFSLPPASPIPFKRNSKLIAGIIYRNTALLQNNNLPPCSCTHKQLKEGTEEVLVNLKKTKLYCN